MSAGCEPLEDAPALFAPSEDAELAGELGERVGVFGDSERFADSGGGDGVAERNQEQTNAATPMEAATRKTTLRESVNA